MKIIAALSFTFSKLLIPILCISVLCQSVQASNLQNVNAGTSDIRPYSSDVVQQVRVAVASNFIKPMQQLKAHFEDETTYKVLVSYSASGKLFAQIINGAPYDVFLSADQIKADKLIKREKVSPLQRFTYATGELILWSSTPLLVNNTSEILETNAFRKVALANPKFAPYGQAAVDVLTNLSLLEQTKPKWVMGESISQTYQFVATGNADIGFISHSQKPEHGSYWLIPPILYTPIRQDAVLLKSAEENAAAIAFFEFLKSNEAKNIIQSHQYTVD